MANNSWIKGCAVTLIMVWMTGSLFAAGGAESKVYEFAETVILGTEYGHAEPVASRWMRPPSISLFYADAEKEQTVRRLADDLNQILSPAKFKIKIDKPHNANASFKVYFVPRSQFESLAKEQGFSYVPGNAGFFHIRWNPGHEINQAVVLIDEKLQGKKLTHYVYEEITQALGLANDSPAFKDSIFYQKGSDSGKAKEFSETDKKLILFFFRHIKPGYDRGKIRAAFDKYWISD